MSKHRNPANIAQRAYFKEARTGLPKAIAVADLRSTSKKGMQRIARTEYRRLMKNFGAPIPEKYVAVPAMPKPAPKLPSLDQRLAAITQQVLGRRKITSPIPAKLA